MKRSPYSPGTFGYQANPEDYLHGLIDPALTVGGGLLGEAVGGLMALPVAAFQGNEAANQMLEAVRNRAAYTPENQQGQQNTQSMLNTLAPLGEQFDKFTDYSANRLQSFADIHGGLGGAGYMAGKAALELTGLLGVPAAIKQANKLNDIGSRINPTRAPITPMSRQQGIIAGESAKTANMDKLEQALQMKQQGASPDDIYTQTQWWLDHPDGKPRFEIDDSGMNMTPLNKEVSIQRLDDAVSHDELFKNYDIGGLMVSKSDGDYYSAGTSSIGYGRTENTQKAAVDWYNHLEKKLLDQASSHDDLPLELADKYEARLGNLSDRAKREIGRRQGETLVKPTTGHEIQHVIQGEEGMARGGMPGQFYQDLKEIKGYADFEIDKLNAEASKLSKDMDVLRDQRYKHPGKEWTDKVDKQISRLSAKYNDVLQKRGEHIPNAQLDIGEEAFNRYHKLGGESEARLASDRINLTPEERTARPFYKEYDVNPEDMIISNKPGLVQNSIEKPDWAISSKQYNTPSTKKQTEAFYIPVGQNKIEVVQNPSSSDISSMRKEALSQYGTPGNNDPALRSTEDANGNKYYWKSYEAIHNHIEPELSNKVGAELNQNAGQKRSHRNIVREALYNGEKVPEEVLSEYPGLIDEVREIKGNKLKPLTQYEQAHKAAQQNAALPASEGGLGLLSGNTAMDRANAMNYQDGVYHGTGSLNNIIENGFDPELTGKGADQIGSGFYTTTDPHEASGYTGYRQQSDIEKLGGEDSPGILPLMIRQENPIEVKGSNLIDTDVDLTQEQVSNILKYSEQATDYENTPLWNFMDIGEGPVEPWMLDEVADRFTGPGLISLEGDFFGGEAQNYRNALNDTLGYDGVKQQFQDKAHKVAWKPNQLRSRFAAFDPFKKNSDDILASMLPYGFGGLLGYNMYEDKQR